MQAAITFIGAAPWYPDVLAMANVVASQTGQPTPATVVEEASSIRLPSSVEAALRRNEQGPGPSGQGAAPADAPARLQHDQTPALLMQLPPAAAQQGNLQAFAARFGHAQPPPGQATSPQSAPTGMPAGHNPPQSTATAASWTNFSLPADMERPWHLEQQAASEAQLVSQDVRGRIHSQIATSVRMGGVPDPPLQQIVPNMLSTCAPMGSQQTSGGGRDSHSVSMASTPAFTAPQPAGSPGSVCDGPAQAQGQPRAPNSVIDVEMRNPSVPMRSSIADMPASFSTEYPASAMPPPGFSDASMGCGRFHIGNEDRFSARAASSAPFHMGNPDRFSGSFPPSGGFPFGNTVGPEPDARAMGVNRQMGTNHQVAGLGPTSSGALLGTLSELMDMSGLLEGRQGHLPDAQMSVSGGLPTVSSGMEIDFSRTWSPMLRNGSGRLPSTISFGLPLRSGVHKFPSALSLTMPTDMTALSPAISFMLPDMATILAGVDANGQDDGAEPFWTQWGQQLGASRQ
jgi:hypothetical protein